MTVDAYDFRQLDNTTRALMLDEFELDIATHGHPYLGKTLTARGLADYPGLLRQAIDTHDEVWLTAQLNEQARVASEPADAARRLARTEFNRYYIRGICRLAETHESTTVVPYRAHDSSNRRAESVALENEPQSAPRILGNLRGRAAQGDAESGLGRVNSGMSARCGCASCSEAAQ